MQWSDHYRRYSRYNAWINQSLLQASLSLSVKDQSKDLKVFFHSLIGSWNHILVGDLFWLNRLAKIFPILDDQMDHWPQPTTLDQVLYNNLEDLAKARQKLDELIIQWCDFLRESDCEDRLEYFNSQEELRVKPLPDVMQHLFNHQTHHRGQITALLSQLGVKYGTTDFIAMPGDD
ncbi:MAG: putative damage-inducible protein DinB [Glaciecola sp.]|jgi:uncharacterized damage-inducible protein DinB